MAQSFDRNLLFLRTNNLEYLPHQLDRTNINTSSMPIVFIVSTTAKMLALYGKIKTFLAMGEDLKKGAELIENTATGGKFSPSVPFNKPT